MTRAYRSISLTDMLCEIGEEQVEKIFSDFSCPDDFDIEYFIKSKAIPFEKSGISRTFLVYVLLDEGTKWVGYYSLSRKPLFFKNNLSGKEKRMFYGTRYSVETGVVADPIINPGEKYIDSILLGQLSKNFYNGNDKYISGDVLINLAFKRVVEWYKMCGGITFHLDCKNIKYIRDFYEKHGFSCYDKRETSDGIYFVYIMPLKELIKKFDEVNGECIEEKAIDKLKLSRKKFTSNKKYIKKVTTI